jgi:gamma-glutamyl-gamma-aminobutyrate hydrolase PuuD
MKKVMLTARMDTVERTGEVRDAVDTMLSEFLASLGLEVIIVPNHLRNFRRLLASFKPDAIVLSGGNDVGSAPSRDAVERAAVRWSRLHRKPLLGVCRGLQLINVAFGGKLAKNLARKGPDHAGTRHAVRILETFPLAAWRGRTIEVNSYHNHGVKPDGLAPRLIAMALSPDGLVEALRHTDLPIYAVQWHPEREGAPRGLDKALFKAALAMRPAGKK